MENAKVVGSSWRGPTEARSLKALPWVNTALIKIMYQNKNLSILIAQRLGM